ncbi:MAG: 50S ribosomal protein L35 [Thermoleophilia bacterium]
MPKNKTHSGAKKRFKVTGTGRLRRRRAFQSHLLTKKTSKRKRKFRKEQDVHASNRSQARKLLNL